MGTHAVERGEASARVAQTVRSLRVAQRMTQKALANELGRLGRPLLTSGVSKIEAGERRVDVDDLVVLAQALGVTPGELLSGEIREDLPLSKLNDDDHDALITYTRARRAVRERGISDVGANAYADHAAR